MDKVSVGIYIGRNFIDAVELSGSFRKPALIEHIRTEIKTSQDDAFSSKEDLNKKIIGAISSTLGKLKTKPDKVYSVLSEAGIMVRHFDMPILPKSEQAQAIKFEARKYIPFKIENVISDFKIINISKDKGIMRIFFVAAEKTDVESHLRFFQDANIKVSGIDITPFALLRTLHINGKPLRKDETLALLQLNIAENLVSINIIESNFSTISRDIPISQDKETLMERLISELRLSFDYYKRKASSKEIIKLIICGKGDLSPLSKRLAEELNIAAEIIDLSKPIKGLKLDSVGAIIAAGAAMNGLGRDVYGVNLLPEYAKVKEAKVEKWLTTVSSIAAAVFLFIILYSVSIVFSARSHFKIALKEAETLPAATQGMPVGTLENLKKEKLETVAFLKSLLTKKIYLTEKLNRIAADLPEGVWVTSFEAKDLSDSKITMSLQGEVFSIDTSQQMNMANRFLEALKQDKIFMEGFDYCEFGNLKRETRGEYDVTSYSIQCGSREGKE